jgi:hypothetical protein
MRKETKEVTSAFLCGSAKKGKNSYTDGQSLFLFGNKIAEHRDGGLWICSCGYVTRTTSDRLNALPNVNLHIKGGYFFLNGDMWSGEWTRVADSLVSINKDVVGSMYDMTKRWISFDAYSGYYEPIYAVCGANDTGTYDDSPCPSGVATKELSVIKSLFNNMNIRHKEVVCETSNVFCVHRYLVTTPRDVEKARDIVEKYILSHDTQLLYMVISSNNII